MERIEMSQEERERLEWLKRAKDGVVRQREAARRMGVTDRWVRKLLKRMKRHGIVVSDETLRGWMIEAGLWKPGARRMEEIHCWRPRRSAFGELVQWDTSEHDWLEGRGPVRYLVRLIDDATSWSWGRFVERDATPFNMAVLWEYLEKNGRMVDVYTDRDSTFAVAPRAPLRIG
jgi:hypothetical protein